MCRLISETDLINIPQRHYRPALGRASGIASRKVLTAEMEPDIPEHDLEPPRFARMSSSGGGGGSSGPDVGTHHAGRSSARRMASEDFDLIEGDEGEREGDAYVDNSDHDDGEGNGRSGGRDVVNVGSESDMELDLLAKSESDSDDNEHNHASDNQSTHTQVCKIIFKKTFSLNNFKSISCIILLGKQLC